MVQKKPGNYLHRWIRRSLKYNWWRYKGPPHYTSLKISTPAWYPTASKELWRESGEFVGGGVGGRRGSVQEGRWDHPWQLTVPVSSMGLASLKSSNHNIWTASLVENMSEMLYQPEISYTGHSAETHNLTSLWENESCERFQSKICVYK